MALMALKPLRQPLKENKDIKHQNNVMIKDNNSNIGSYKNLIVYKKTVLIFKMTHYFCTTFLNSKDRTVDQMIQAARSGKQNIVEGCSAGKKSLKSKEFLINVAKSSLKELLEDYEDFLRIHNHRQWEDNSAEKIKMREIASNPKNDKLIFEIVKNRPSEVIANIAIVLINQADYLLYKFQQKIEKDWNNNPP